MSEDPREEAHVGVCGKGFPGRKQPVCTGPEVGVCPSGPRTCEEATETRGKSKGESRPGQSGKERWEGKFM